MSEMTPDAAIRELELLASLLRRSHRNSELIAVRLPCIEAIEYALSLLQGAAPQSAEHRRSCECAEPNPVMQADRKFYCYTCSFETGARPAHLEPESWMTVGRTPEWRENAFAGAKEPPVSPAAPQNVERFIPHGSTCEADHDNGTDFGRCGEPARQIVTHQGRDRYVCQPHFERFKEPPVPSSPSSGAQPPVAIIEAAVRAAGVSPCRSKRGVVVFLGDQVVSSAYNDQVSPFECDGSLSCKTICRTTAVHAEQFALLQAGKMAAGCDLLHVKVAAGVLVPSGGPSCVQCSKLMIPAGIMGVWLFHESGWRRYETPEFHRLSVEATMAFAPSTGAQEK